VGLKKAAEACAVAVAEACAVAVAEACAVAVAEGDGVVGAGDAVAVWGAAVVVLGMGEVWGLEEVGVVWEGAEGTAVVGVRGVGLGYMLL
jgi:hypothetical protein